MEGAEEKWSERGDRNLRGHRWWQLRREDRGSVRRIAVERRVDDTKVTALRRRSLSVPSGVGIRDDTEVAVRV